MNILTLHAMGDFSTARRTSIKHCKFLETYQPGHNYLFHDFQAPVTPALKAIAWDAILLDVTFLCWRWARPRSAYEKLRETYAFVGESDAVKIAFPQDEYDHGGVLDAWLDDWKVDAVYSVVWSHWDLMFPRTKQRAEIIGSLTGYVDDEDIRTISPFAKPYAQRTIDVGYRARRLPPEFGRHGQLKYLLGERFLAANAGRGMVLDISNRPEDAIVGDGWLRFLGNSKFQLGNEGGSSIWDPDGAIRDRVHAFVAAHPQASFEDVEAACFPGLDRAEPFSAISPRMFETALTRTAQALVRAPYLGELRPDEHYIPIERDLSNMAEVADRMRDDVAAERMIEATYAALIAPPTYRYGHHAAQVMAKIRELHARKGVRGISTWRYEALLAAHREWVVRRADYGRARAWAGKLNRRVGPGRIKRALKKRLGR